jgi:hypothetical protein
VNPNSVFAYESAELKSGPQRRKAVYAFVLSRGEEGATDDEVIQHLGIQHASMAGTRHDLEKLGALVGTNRNRLTVAGNPAEVWVAVPGVKVDKRPPKTEREILLTGARRVIENMTDAELEGLITEFHHYACVVKKKRRSRGGLVAGRGEGRAVARPDRAGV